MHDVRNAINCTLENIFHEPNNLLRILRDYLGNRSLFYETIEGKRRMEVRSGVAQGSILEPDLWNASLLKLDMPEKSRLVGYGDDVTAVVAGRTVEQVKQTRHIDATGKRMDYYSWFQPCTGKKPK